jgi:HAD superfamily hydrolase (TIGR01509 family)
VGLAASRIEASLGCEVPEAHLRQTLGALVDAHPIEPMPGAVTLLDALAGQLPLAVATNAPLEIAEAVLERAGLGRFFDRIVSAEETAQPKPAPDVYLEACRRLALEPLEAVAFEDSALGAQSARSAGLTVVAVPESGDRFEADLIAPRLDDARVFGLLGLGDDANRDPEAADREEPPEAASLAL